MNIRPLNKRRRNRRLGEPFSKRAGRFLARFGKVAGAGALGAGLIYTGWMLYGKIMTTPYLAIHSFRVNETHRLTRDEVIALSGLHEGQNILSFKSGDTAEKIKKNPWVEEASVTRRIPDSIEVEVRERQPLAIIKTDSLYVMDRNGVVFKKLSSSDGLDLPVVTGFTNWGIAQDDSGSTAGALELIRVLDGRQGFGIQNVSEIHYDTDYGFSLYTAEDGVRLDMGFDRFEDKLAVFEKILATNDGTLRGITAMDLNNDKEVIVRFSSNVVKEGGAI